MRNFKRQDKAICTLYSVHCLLYLIVVFSNAKAHVFKGGHERCLYLNESQAEISAQNTPRRVEYERQIAVAALGRQRELRPELFHLLA